MDSDYLANLSEDQERWLSLVYRVSERWVRGQTLEDFEIYLLKLPDSEFNDVVDAYQIYLSFPENVPGGREGFILGMGDTDTGLMKMIIHSEPTVHESVKERIRKDLDGEEPREGYFLMQTKLKRAELRGRDLEEN